MQQPIMRGIKVSVHQENIILNFFALTRQIYLKTATPPVKKRKPYIQIVFIQPNQSVEKKTNWGSVIGLVCISSPRIFNSQACLMKAKLFQFCTDCAENTKEKERKKNTMLPSCLLRGYVEPLISK